MNYKRDKIIQAAANIEGSAVLLSEKWDCYLIGYTIQEGTKTVLGVYDMTGLVRGDIDREDAVIEELKGLNGGLKPVLVHAIWITPWYNLGFTFNSPCPCALGSCNHLILSWCAWPVHRRIGKMKNLEKFYPGKKLESFRVGSSALAHDPDDSRYCIDCEECHACEFCDTDLEHRTCIDTFEAWAEMEAK